MYKPNFCNDCGERVDRKRWRVWTNRRFCQRCTTRARNASAFRKPVAILCLIAASYLVGANRQSAPPPLVLERGRFAAMNEQTAQLAPANQTSNSHQLEATPATETTRPAKINDITQADEVVSMCGARTKKGTPCSRRVRGYGRCWQHKGKGAMLAANKLIVRD